MSESLCECGHPHVNPDGSGSCSKFTCPCRVFLADETDEAAERAWSYERAVMKEHDLDA